MSSLSAIDKSYGVIAKKYWTIDQGWYRLSVFGTVHWVPKLLQAARRHPCLLEVTRPSPSFATKATRYSKQVRAVGELHPRATPGYSRSCRHHENPSEDIAKAGAQGVVRGIHVESSGDSEPPKLSGGFSATRELIKSSTSARRRVTLKEAIRCAYTGESCLGEHGINKEACNAKSGRVGPMFGSIGGGRPELMERASTERLSSVRSKLSPTKHRHSKQLKRCALTQTNKPRTRKADRVPLPNLIAHYRLKELVGENQGRKAFSTRAAYESYLKVWILPRWGDHTTRSGQAGSR